MKKESLAPKEGGDNSEARRIREGVRRAELDAQEKQEKKFGLQEGGAYEIPGLTEEDADRMERVALEARERRESKGQP